jgi:hypothetical protein
MEICLIKTVLGLNVEIKINNNPKVIINVNIKFARSRIRTCEPEGRRLKRRGIDQLTDSR